MTDEGPAARTRALSWRSVGTLLLVFGLTACSAAPRQRPIKMGDVDTGTGSVESARRQLEGTWELQSFETYPAAGQKVPQKATAVLTYDAYGNLEIVGRLEQPDQLPGAGAPLLSYKGRVVIDAGKQQLRVVNAQGDVSKLPSEASTQHLRQYAVEGDRLTLSMIDGAGQPTATTTWKKRAR